MFSLLLLLSLLLIRHMFRLVKLDKNNFTITNRASIIIIGLAELKHIEKIFVKI